MKPKNHRQGHISTDYIALGMYGNISASSKEDDFIGDFVDLSCTRRRKKIVVKLINLYLKLVFLY